MCAAVPPRSWAYIGVHYLVCLVFSPLAGLSKITLLYLLRIGIAVLSLGSDFCLYQSACQRLGNTVGSFFMAFSACSVGMFNASTTFLPSSFSMSLNALALAFYLRERWFLATLCTAVSALLGWPFAAVLGLPIVVEMVLVRGLWLRFLLCALLSGLIVLVPMALVDSIFFGRPTIVSTPPRLSPPCFRHP